MPQIWRNALANRPRLSAEPISPADADRATTGRLAMSATRRGARCSCASPAPFRARALLGNGKTHPKAAMVIFSTSFAKASGSAISPTCSRKPGASSACRNWIRSRIPRPRNSRLHPLDRRKRHGGSSACPVRSKARWRQPICGHAASQISATQAPSSSTRTATIGGRARIRPRPGPP